MASRCGCIYEDSSNGGALAADSDYSIQCVSEKHSTKAVSMQIMVEREFADEGSGN